MWPGGLFLIMDTKWFILAGIVLTSNCVTVFSLPTANLTDIHSTVKSLFEKVRDEQIKENVPFRPPIFWAKSKGMYETDIRLYVHGNEALYLLRDENKMDDMNMFVSTWVSSCLLETFRYGNGPKPSENQLTSAILAIEDFHNKNVNYSNSIMTYWQQKYNVTTKTWRSYPENENRFLEVLASVDYKELEKILRDLGLSKYAKYLAYLPEAIQIGLEAYTIPPDFDDTFVNIGLGALLTEMQNDFPASLAQWRSQNTNITSAFDAVKRYAYRPMSQNAAVNTIDPRSYFYLRHFLDDAMMKGEDIALVTTWVMDTEEEKTMKAKGVHMPFDINNIDVTVAANSVYGITAAICSGLVDVKILDDPELQQVYLNTSSMIAYMIQTNFTSRPDLALLYYPSSYAFYWFVSRTYGELERKSNAVKLPHPVLEAVKDVLDTALHKYMTPALLTAAKVEGTVMVYFDDFLGDGDVNILGEPVIRGEDRLFTTAMAINALLSTWTVFDDSSNHLVWQKDTPITVKETVNKATTFLNKYILHGKYKPWNAFFSGSVKGNSTFPAYPINRFTTYRSPLHNEDTTVKIEGMQGIVPESEYQGLLKKLWNGGYPTPLDFHGFNGYPDSFWPFFSSPTFTYVTSMHALAKFSNIVDS